MRAFATLLSAPLISLATLAVMPSSAMAQNSAQFLSAFEGEWRGSGEARPNLRSEPTRITCRVTATFDAGAVALTNQGRCGTTQGSRNLNGTLKADGASLTGDFLGQAAADGLMNPRAKIDQEMIVSEAEVQDGAQVMKVRTFLTKPVDDAFTVQSQFFDRQANKWVVSGEIAFRRQ